MGQEPHAAAAKMVGALGAGLFSSVLKRKIEDQSLAASNQEKGRKKAGVAIDQEFVLQMTELERSNMNQLRRFSQFQWYIVATKLSKGACFGELALEAEKQEGMRRKATVKAAAPCELAVLRRSDFLRVLKKIEAREIANRADFLHSIPYFQHLSANQVKKLTHRFEAVHY